MATSRHTNLNNPAAEPARAPLAVSCSVFFDMAGAVPADKLTEWLGSLPKSAKIAFTGIASGKVGFTASWTEHR